MPHDKAILIKHHAIKKALVEKKGGKCEICGYDKCIEALQFHHLNPHEKEFGIAATHRNFDELVKEAEKCILVCANCHTELHYNERVSPRG